MQRKMLERAGKQCNKAQLKYCWEHSHKRFTLWTWLESQATGLGRDPNNNCIEADDEWWDSMENKKKGARAFKSSPLRCIHEHHAMFHDRLVVGNHLSVAGSTAITEHEPTGAATTIDVPNLTELAAASPPSSRGRGKRPTTSAHNSGGNKKTCSDSAGEDFKRMVELRIQSTESHARREEKTRAKSSRACMDLVVTDRYQKGSMVWFMAMQLFRDQY